jgi:translation initiation factor IF-2
VNKIGGKIPSVEISAKMKINFDHLEAELSAMSKALSLEEEININAQAFVIESKTISQHQNVNNTASVIVRKGVLKEGDVFICGEDSFGKIRRMTNDLGEVAAEAIPGKAVEIMGFKSVPQAGSILTVFESFEIVESLIENRRKLKNYLESQKKAMLSKGIKLGKLTRKEKKIIRHFKTQFIKQKLAGALSTEAGNDFDKKEIEETYLEKSSKKKKLVIKADAMGMLESIEDCLIAEFSENILDEYILSTSVGAIVEEDFEMAKTTNAVFFCFNIDQEVSEWASIYSVGVRKHKLIYNIVEEIKAFISEAMMMDPESEENKSIKGRLMVKEVFKIKFNSKVLI